MDKTGENIILLFLFLLAVVFAAYFASAETAFASVNKIKLRLRADNGSKKAQRALEVEEHFDKALTAILIGNNAMHIGASAIATLLASRIWGNKAVTVITLIVTLILFLFGETIPKRYAISHPLKLSLSYSFSIRSLMKVLTPLVAFFSAISTQVTRLIHAKAQPTVNEDELQEIIEDYSGENEREDHTQLIRSAFRFSSSEIRELYTPVSDVVSISIDTPREEAAEIIRQNAFTRLPVYDGPRDNLVGVLNTKIFLKNYIRNTDTAIRNLMMDLPSIRLDCHADDAIELMKTSHKQMLAVRDPDDKVVGILTSDDVLGKLVGEIIDDSLSAGEEGADA